MSEIFAPQTKKNYENMILERANILAASLKDNQVD